MLIFLSQEVDFSSKIGEIWSSQTTNQYGNVFRLFRLFENEFLKLNQLWLYQIHYYILAEFICQNFNILLLNFQLNFIIFIAKNYEETFQNVVILHEIFINLHSKNNNNNNYNYISTFEMMKLYMYIDKCKLTWSK